MRRRGVDIRRSCKMMAKSKSFKKESKSCCSPRQQNSFLVNYIKSQRFSPSYPSEPRLRWTSCIVVNSARLCISTLNRKRWCFRLVLRPRLRRRPPLLRHATSKLGRALRMQAQHPLRSSPRTLGCHKGCGLHWKFEPIWTFELTPYLELSNLQRA